MARDSWSMLLSVEEALEALLQHQPQVVSQLNLHKVITKLTKQLLKQLMENSINMPHNSKAAFLESLHTNHFLTWSPSKG